MTSYFHERIRLDPTHPVPPVVMNNNVLRFVKLLDKMVILKDNPLPYKRRNARKKGFKIFFRTWPCPSSVPVELAVAGVNHLLSARRWFDSVHSVGKVLFHLLPQATQHLTEQLCAKLFSFTLLQSSDSFKPVAEWLFFDQHYHSILLPQPAGIQYQLSDRFKFHETEMSNTSLRQFCTIFYLLGFSEPNIALTTNHDDYKKAFQKGLIAREKRIGQIEAQCTLSLFDWPISLVRFILLPYVILL